MSKFSDEALEGLGDAIKRHSPEGRGGADVGPRTAAGGPRWPEAQEAEPSFGSSTHTRDVGRARQMRNGNYRLAAMERSYGHGQARDGAGARTGSGYRPRPLKVRGS